MKRFVAFLLLVFLFTGLIGSVGFAERKEIVGGLTRDSAVEITEKDMGQEILMNGVNEGWDGRWFIVRAQEDTTIHITLYPPEDEYAQLLIYDRWENLLVDQPYIKKKEFFTFPLAAGEYLYIYHFKLITASVCSSAIHQKGIFKQTLSEPTCIQTGEFTYLCDLCNQSTSIESIPATGHMPGSWTQSIEPTCLLVGCNEQRCTVCNELLHSEEIPVLAHTLAPWLDERIATCTASGVRSQYCTGCNLRMNTETVDAYGHSLGEWVTTRESSCLQNGLKEKSCSVCGAVVESEVLPALGHVYTNWEITTEATNQQQGEQRRNCIYCGDTQYDVIDQLKQ